MKKQEPLRQFVHIIAGLFFLVFFLMFGRVPLILLAFSLLVGGSLIIHFKLIGNHLPIIHDIGDRLERPDARIPGWGPALYLIAILMVATVLSDSAKIAVGIIILGISDGASTLIGIHGTHRLPYNARKTIEGSTAFFVTSIFGYFFIGVPIIPLALLTTFIEGIDTSIDDNLLVPFIATVYLFFF